MLGHTIHVEHSFLSVSVGRLLVATEVIGASRLLTNTQATAHIQFSEHARGAACHASATW